VRDGGAGALAADRPWRGLRSQEAPVVVVHERR